MTNSCNDVMHRTEIFVGGKWIRSAGSEVIDVIDPATENIIGSVPNGTAEDVERAVRAAREAFGSWSQTSPEERAVWAQRIADAVTARADDFAELIAREIGMPLAQSRAIQVKLGIGDFAVMPQAISEITWEEKIDNSIVLREPIGVVGAITPWNYPLHQVTAKVAGALCAGCTVVVKPSEVAPFSVFLLAEVLDVLGLPPGVVNIVTGEGGTVGEALVAHPGIDMISFTGSTRAGRRISEIAAARVKPLAMELGGKSAAVVLDDADLEQAITVTLSKCYQNAGQTCNALTRLLVPRSRLAEAEWIAAAAAAEYRPGRPFGEGSTLGPLASEDQFRRVRSLIDKGIEEGARLVHGGADRPEGLERGYFVAPTVFSDVSEDMLIAQEEIFGPVAVIIGFDDEEDAIRIANGTDYGLAGAVWSADASRAHRVARRLRSGQVAINGGAYNPRAPFGGFKQSGHGREGGRFGIEEFLTYKSLQV
ncbi:aldehyde dehydrogenase family protein [Nocardia vaccinii]|uniref:aldehyde dehydrogenase family protein n=1 Tax=Nocardia vaccinii TaxID=1822 RepID=UPI000A5FEA72|nr:aldehyde dehydrogenase family protein [Nocardia vaccinii]